jgi:lipoprotein-anchoring transpeptidase ErfK/SrfK
LDTGTIAVPAQDAGAATASTDRVTVVQRVVWGLLLLAGVALLFLAAARPAHAAEAPPLTLSATPAKVISGRSATLTASVGFAGAVLQVSERRGAETAYTPAGSVTSGADGTVSWQVSPTQSTTYRVEFAGDATWAAASAETTVSVALRLAFQATKRVYAGRSIVFKAASIPAHPGARLELQIRRGGVWKTLRTFKLDRRSRAVVKLKARKKGAPRFRVIMAPSDELAAAVSRTRTVRIKKGNPYGVPIGPARFIVVDRSQYKLHYLEHGTIVRSFNCVLGRPGLPTPLGRFRVWSRGVNPGGPFGVRVLWYYRGYGIHGTDQPWLLTHWPRAYSHGCTRLANANALWLFNRCPVGTQVWNVP